MISEKVKGLKWRIRTPKPVMVNANAEEPAIEDNAGYFGPPIDMPYNVNLPEYSRQVASMIGNTNSGTDAVHQLKSFGTKVSRPDETWSRCLKLTLSTGKSGLRGAQASEIMPPGDRRRKFVDLA